MKTFLLVIIIILNLNGMVFAQRKTFSLNNEPDFEYAQQFIGKHVILDLFNSTCTVCFASFPKINELQQKFKEEIRFVLVGDEDKRIRELYDHVAKRLDLKLDVQYDSNFFNRIRIPYVPFYVWIKPDGKIAALTGPNLVNEENIEAFLQGRFAYDVFEHLLTEFNYKRPLLLEGNGGSDTIYSYRTIFGDWDRSMKKFFPAYLKFVGNTGMFQVLGASLSDLYSYAYFGKNDWKVNDSLYGNAFKQCIVEEEGGFSKDSMRYFYSFIMPNGKSDRSLLQRCMQNDLRTYFNYDVTFEKRMLPYWSVFIRPGYEERLRSKGGPSSQSGNPAEFHLRNMPLKGVLLNLEARNKNDLQFIDETELGSRFDLDLAGNLSDFEHYRKALFDQGIDLQIKNKEMTVIVLKRPEVQP